MLVSRYYQFARSALILADQADRDTTFDLCALVVRKNRVLAVGYNHPKTHPISHQTNVQQLHAELEAIIRTPERNLSGCDMIVVRLTKGKRPGLAKPCKICQALIAKSGARRIFFTNGNGTTENPELEQL